MTDGKHLTVTYESQFYNWFCTGTRRYKRAILLQSMPGFYNIYSFHDRNIHGVPLFVRKIGQKMDQVVFCWKKVLNFVICQKAGILGSRFLLELLNFVCVHV